MKKPQSIFLLIIASIIVSCSKSNVNPSSTNAPASDVVVGNYLAMNVPPNYVAGSATVSKTSGGKYQFTPGSASIPSFNFQYDPISSFFMGSNFAYLIPKQTSNSVLLDTAYITLYTSGVKTISFTLTNRTTGASWTYNGVKQ